ncbi:MAG: hypothetical protein ABI763_14550 [Bacteroidota bacterium]
MKRKLYPILFIIAISVAGCKYVTQLSKRDHAYNYYTALLDTADGINNETEKLNFFIEHLKKNKSNSKARIANARVLLELSSTKNQSDSIKDLMAAICEQGFFIRKFDQETQSEMFYRFEKPNWQGLGKMVLSDRYRNGFFDEQSANNKYYIRDFNYSFQRIYFIRKNELHILSGDCDLTDRKVFKRLNIESDTIFSKTSTFRKNNNDEIYDISYSFKYIPYYDIKQRWKSIGNSNEDSTTITTDKVNYISYAALKNIIIRENIDPASLNIDLVDTNYNGHWFYAGTINPMQEYESNYTNIETVKKIDDCIKDSSNTIEVRTLLYVRQHPPGDYKIDKAEQIYKGDINGSLEPKQKIHIMAQRRIKDFKGNESLWLQIRDAMPIQN